MRRLVTAAVVVCGAIGAAGCLAADTSHVLYLRPDGAVTWAVLERDVRSRDDDPLVRAREESEFVAAAGAARHPIGLGLTRLGPDRLSARVLRRERPYTVLTEAGFERIDRLVERFFAELHVAAQATLLADAQGGTLTVSI